MSKTPLEEYSKKAPEGIEALFDSIAPRYDRVNAYMSLGIFKYWNRICRDWVAASKPLVFGDLCGGTGEITHLLLKKIPLEKGFIIDFSSGMLDVAKKSLGLTPHIETLHADVCSIPLPDKSLDAAAMAYGIRNVKEREKALSEAYRLIRPGGVFAILELTRPKNPLLRLFHSIYLKTCIPLIGKFGTKNQAAYTYLSESVHTFIDPSKLSIEIKRAGFENIQTRSLSFGAATLFTMRRPPSSL